MITNEGDLFFYFTNLFIYSSTGKGAVGEVNAPSEKFVSEQRVGGESTALQFIDIKFNKIYHISLTVGNVLSDISFNCFKNVA